MVQKRNIYHLKNALKGAILFFAFVYLIPIIGVSIFMFVVGGMGNISEALLEIILDSSIFRLAIVIGLFGFICGGFIKWKK